MANQFIQNNPFRMKLKRELVQTPAASNPPTKPTPPEEPEDALWLCEKCGVEFKEEWDYDDHKCKPKKGKKAKNQKGDKN